MTKEIFRLRRKLWHFRVLSSVSKTNSRLSVIAMPTTADSGAPDSETVAKTPSRCCRRKFRRSLRVIKHAFGMLAAVAEKLQELIARRRFDADEREVGIHVR